MLYNRCHLFRCYRSLIHDQCILYKFFTLLFFLEFISVKFEYQNLGKVSIYGIVIYMFD